MLSLLQNIQHITSVVSLFRHFIFDSFARCVKETMVNRYRIFRLSISIFIVKVRSNCCVCWNIVLSEIIKKPPIFFGNLFVINE